MKMIDFLKMKEEKERKKVGVIASLREGGGFRGAKDGRRVREHCTHEAVDYKSLP